MFSLVISYPRSVFKVRGALTRLFRPSLPTHPYDVNVKRAVAKKALEEPEYIHTYYEFKSLEQKELWISENANKHPFDKASVTINPTRFFELRGKNDVLCV